MSAPECLRVLFERAFTSEGASSVQVRRVDVCFPPCVSRETRQQTGSQRCPARPLLLSVR